MVAEAMGVDEVILRKCQTTVKEESCGTPNEMGLREKRAT